MYFSAYYICTGKRKADSPPNPFSPVFFIFSRRDGCSPAGIVPGVVAVSFFVEKKEKKRKRENGAGVSLKKRDIFRALNFMIWSVAVLNVILVKQDYQNYLPEIFGRKSVGFITGSSQHSGSKKCTPL